MPDTDNHGNIVHEEFAPVTGASKDSAHANKDKRMNLANSQEVDA